MSAKAHTGTAQAHCIATGMPVLRSSSKFYLILGNTRATYAFTHSQPLHMGETGMENEYTVMEEGNLHGKLCLTFRVLC